MFGIEGDRECTFVCGTLIQPLWNGDGGALTSLHWNFFTRFQFLQLQGQLVGALAILKDKNF